MTSDDGQSASGPVAVKVEQNWKTRGLDMLFNQGPVVVVLVGIIGLATLKVPAHLEAIKAGYKEISAEARAERADIMKVHAETIRELQTTFKADKEWDRQWLLNRNQGAALKRPTHVEQVQ